MTVRTRREVVTFTSDITLSAIGTLPAGDYEIITDEELVEGLSFPVYRRVNTWMLVPAANTRSAFEMASVDPRDLDAAIARCGVR